MSAVTGDTIADCLQQVGSFRTYKDFLVSIKLPDSLEKIGNYAFTNCASLESVVFPDMLEDLGKGAFLGCTELNTVTQPGTVTDILDSAFEGCASLDFDSAFFANIEKIGESAFAGSGITSFTILEKVTVLSRSAFENCKHLTTVNLSNMVSSLDFIDISLFSGCSSLSNLVLPAEGPKSIKASAFYGCSELVNVTLPTTLGNGSTVAIGASAFENCTKLATVTWNRKVGLGNFNLIFGSKAFKDCISLAGFTIPEGAGAGGIGTFVQSANAPFQGSGLVRITLPSSLKTISANSFYGATNLVEINISKPSAATFNGTALANVNAFTGTPIGNKDANAHIYVPDETSATAYKGTTNWSNLASLISVKP
jgi:hypothetical protein